MAFVGQNFLAGLTGPLLESRCSSALSITGYFRHCLLEGRIDRFSVTYADFEHIVDHFLGAFLLADTTAGAVIGVNIAGFLADLYR